MHGSSPNHADPRIVTASTGRVAVAVRDRGDGVRTRLLWSWRSASLELALGFYFLGVCWGDFRFRLDELMLGFFFWESAGLPFDSDSMS